MKATRLAVLVTVLLLPFTAIAAQERPLELASPFVNDMILQREMEVGLVTPTSKDFVVGNGLDETAFGACYLKGASLDAVHSQLALGHQVGVNATPTYFINGWMVQMPRDEWFADMISRLAKGEEP